MRIISLINVFWKSILKVRFDSILGNNMNLDILDKVALALVIVGGLNWGLVGALKFDLVQTLFGFMPILADLIYIIVGLSALYMIYAGYIKK
jgi:uncharacterized protein